MNLTDLLNEVIVSGLGLGLVGIAYLAWFLSGAIPNLFSDKKWSWRKGAEDVCKALLMGVVVLLVVTVANLGKSYATVLGFDISEVADVVSTYSLAGAMVYGIFFYLGKAIRNAVAFLGLGKGTVKGDKDKFEQGVKEIGENTLEIVNGIVTALYTPPEAQEAQEKFEQEDGRGMAYSVNISSYDAFRSIVMGKGYDIDGAYGFQCWDGTALLWQQLGLSLITGNGCAYGCWTLKRDVNKYDKFELITDKSKIKKGDVLVFRTGEFGHIGFADEDYNNPNSIKLLGQNQGGTPKGAGGGAGFNIINMSLATFLGAFRYKGWATTEKKDDVVVTPTVEANVNPGDYVEVTRFYDVNGTKLRSLQSCYRVTQTNPTSALLITDDGDIYARMPLANIKKVDNTSPNIVQKEAEQRQASQIKEGDIVAPIKLVDYDGRKLRLTADSYKVSQVKLDRAVLVNDKGQVYAAVQVDNLKKV